MAYFRFAMVGAITDYDYLVASYQRGHSAYVRPTKDQVAVPYVGKELELEAQNRRFLPRGVLQNETAPGHSGGARSVNSASKSLASSGGPVGDFNGFVSRTDLGRGITTRALDSQPASDNVITERLIQSEAKGAITSLAPSSSMASRSVARFQPDASAGIGSSLAAVA